ncbi:MAG: hypothetical protein U0Q18_28770 [Bryobacteraceae bacterium]
MPKPALLIFLALSASLQALDLTNAVITHPKNFTGPELKSVNLLIDEVEKRSGLRWSVAQSESNSQPAIRIDLGQGPAEGYAISTTGPFVTIRGNDERGVLFGIGRLLRELNFKLSSVTLRDGFQETSAPRYRLRGHQLGYRPKTNTYDAWTVADFEQYIRDLAVFGTNAIEIIPPRSDDAPAGPQFHVPPMRMMVEQSRIARDYGLDVWIWYPAMDVDYANPATVESALQEWGEVFRQLPRIDAVFVPGGDPGHTRPKYLLALLAKETEVLHRYHPKAQMWVSPQSFNREWMAEFFAILRDQSPAWLSGVVYGPQTRISLVEMRAQVPTRYPIRNYPDITHNMDCEFPVPDWDPAYAVTEARESINPQPVREAKIFHAEEPNTIGFLTYSEGTNDDVNKFVWSGLGWNPDQDVKEILRQFGHYFIGDALGDRFADGLLALESNWRGPLLPNDSVQGTFQKFEAMELAASPHVLRNWRFQQALYRAYYDAYTRRRLEAETNAEAPALRKLRDTRDLAAAARLLNEPVRVNPAPELRARISELAEALFQSIGMQLSVQRYKAIAVDRGASLDTLDMPLNDRNWLTARFREAEKDPAVIDRILNWTDPGPGGFYDDLGDSRAQPHLVRGSNGLEYRRGWRKSWWTYAESFYDDPLQMRYTGLDPSAQYKVRVVYAGDSMLRKIRLAAGDGIEVHPLLRKPEPVAPVEFDVPRAATAKGELELSWYGEPGLGGNGRGCQVSEVWLIKK